MSDESENEFEDPFDRLAEKRRILQRINMEEHVWRQKSIVNQVKNPLFADRLWGDGGDLRDAGKIISRHDPMRDWDIADSIPVSPQDNTLRGGLDYRERLQLQIMLKRAGIPVDNPKISKRRLTYMIVRYLREHPQTVHNAVESTKNYQRNMKNRSIANCHDKIRQRQLLAKIIRHLKKERRHEDRQPALFDYGIDGGIIYHSHSAPPTRPHQPKNSVETSKRPPMI